MSDALTPTEGARFLFERESEHDGDAVYRLTVFTPAATFAGHATLAADGAVALELDAPVELREYAEMLAKLTARTAAKKLADGMPPWPNRVLRWRGPGRGE